MTTADLVLKNANVITMDPARPIAQNVAVKKGKILGVFDGDASSFIVSGTRVVDCGGGAVLPGFNDAHCHLYSIVRSLLSIDLGEKSIRSLADVRSAIQQRALRTPPGRWISATGLNDFYLAEKRLPTRHDLDRATTDHPVIVTHLGLHACILNSLALSMAGIDVETPEPPGARIERDLNGEPNGILFEMLPWLRSKVIPPMTQDELREGFAAANRMCLKNGITSVQDASANNDLSRWQVFKQIKETGLFQPRVSMMVGRHNINAFQKQGLVTGSGDHDLKIGSVKVLLGEAAGHVDPISEELDKLFEECRKLGFQVALHAVQESCVEAAITALEKVNLDGQSVARRRHRIEHCSECPPPLLQRLRRIRPVIVTQPAFLYYSGERYLATVPEAMQPWLYRVGSFFNAGLVVAASSDAPVVPNSVIHGIYAAVTRRAASGQYVRPEESTSLERAIAAYTRNAAYASFEDDVKGTLAPGMLADMVVLNGDPLSVDKEAIKDLKVKMTIIGGKVVWES